MKGTVCVLFIPRFSFLVFCFAYPFIDLSWIPPALRHPPSPSSGRIFARSVACAHRGPRAAKRSCNHPCLAFATYSFWLTCTRAFPLTSSHPTCGAVHYSKDDRLPPSPSQPVSLADVYRKTTACRARPISSIPGPLRYRRRHPPALPLSAAKYTACSLSRLTRRTVTQTSKLSLVSSYTHSPQQPQHPMQVFTPSMIPPTFHPIVPSSSTHIMYFGGPPPPALSCCSLFIVCSGLCVSFCSSSSMYYFPPFIWTTHAYLFGLFPSLPGAARTVLSYLFRAQALFFFLPFLLRRLAFFSFASSSSRTTVFFRLLHFLSLSLFTPACIATQTPCNHSSISKTSSSVRPHPIKLLPAFKFVSVLGRLNCFLFSVLIPWTHRNSLSLVLAHVVRTRGIY